MLLMIYIPIDREAVAASFWHLLSFLREYGHCTVYSFIGISRRDESPQLAVPGHIRHPYGYLL